MSQGTISVMCPDSFAGNEPLFLSGREALKIQKIICDIYKNNDNPF